MTITCDANFSNIYFLLEQKKIQLTTKGDFSFYYYDGQSAGRKGWLFPREITSQNKEVLKDYLTVLLEIDPAPAFILLDEEQKEMLWECVKTAFPNYSASFDSDQGDSDYVYSVEKMAELPGKSFQKKRNHVSRFLRTFGHDWSFRFYAGGKKRTEQKVENESAHIQAVYNQWKKNHLPDAEGYLLAEEKSLEIAVRDFEKLSLIAGILYVKNEPVAFLIASFTTENCLNVHFEKCLEDFADCGALSFLNRQFAQKIREAFPDCIYLNREEDLNIEGLRKSKLSYQPEFLIKKYFCHLTK